MIINFEWKCSQDTDIRYVSKRYCFYDPQCDDACEFIEGNTLTGACIQFCESRQVTFNDALAAFWLGGCKAEFFDVTECEDLNVTECEDPEVI